MKEREPLQRRLEDIKGDEERDAKAVLNILGSNMNVVQEDATKKAAEDAKKAEDSKKAEEGKKLLANAPQAKPAEEEAHKNLIDLEEEASLRLKRFNLNDKEKKDLLLLLRFKFITHEKLLQASKVFFFPLLSLTK